MVVFDEIWQQPTLFPVLWVLIGESPGQKQSHAGEEPWTSSNNMYTRNATAVPTASPEVMTWLLVKDQKAMIDLQLFSIRGTPML
jgi:hypothetical protein